MMIIKKTITQVFKEFLKSTKNLKTLARILKTVPYQGT